jgi:hypothetical protein
MRGWCMENKKSTDESRRELADYMAQVITGQKAITTIAPPQSEPEELNYQAKTERAWRELPRGYEKRAVLGRDELLRRPVIWVKIGVWKKRPGEVLVDRLREIWAREGVVTGDAAATME